MALWGILTCPYVQRVRIALSESKLEWEDKIVAKVSESAELTSLFALRHPHLNPAVPLLQHWTPEYDTDIGLVLPESDVIITYLQEEYSEVSLLPPRADGRATVRLFIPLFMSKLLPCVRKLFTASTNSDLDATVDSLDSGCAALDAFLRAHDQSSPSGDRAGDFVAGDLFSMAECVTAPHLQRLRLIPSPSIRPQTTAALLTRLTGTHDAASIPDPFLYFLFHKYPRLHSWASAVLSRESVVSTFPAETVTSVIAGVTAPWVAT